MTWPLYILLSLIALVFVYTVFRVLQRSRRQVWERLRKVRNLESDDEAMLDKPFGERVLKPASKAISLRLQHLKPSELRRFLIIQLTYAGHPWGINASQLLGLQVALGLLLPLLLFIASKLLAPAGQTSLLHYIFIGLTGFLFPYALIRLKVIQRQDDISRSMPMMLDLLLISVEAGMSLDMALKRVTEVLTGPLSQELQRFQEEMQMGRPRSEALKAMVERTGVEDLWLFTISVIQAEQRWGNIAEALEKQACFLRKKRRRRAEEEARKAPVKMLFPLVFFVFPAMFVVLLGPALLRIYQIFGELF